MKRHCEEAARCAIAKSNELLASANAKTVELLASAIAKKDELLASAIAKTDELLASAYNVEQAMPSFVKDDEHEELLDPKTFLTEDHDQSTEEVMESKPCSLDCWMQQHSGDEKGFLQDVKLVCPPGRALFLLCSKLAGLSRVDSASAYE